MCEAIHDLKLENIEDSDEGEVEHGNYDFVYPTAMPLSNRGCGHSSQLWRDGLDAA
ncbi:unnamed protein product [Rodentolepis nana]|uniref:Uncharacterized protein n=1 Tax=Rodentolepis nana TaxID=102285 RepID=A0A0R3TVU4_RODNA|nr:unnamed protein product [Rodentolepis nana]